MSTHTHNSTREALTQTDQSLDTLITQVRHHGDQATEPKAQALFEATAEVLIGLRKAYADYLKGDEKAWQ